jgi:hypothetical protein
MTSGRPVAGGINIKVPADALCVGNAMAVVDPLRSIALALSVGNGAKDFPIEGLDRMGSI